MNGVINVYKEAGFTSHDVVAKLRGILKMKKIGHTGTLDPDAVGVLPVCLGKATKLCDMLGDDTKTYEAVLLLGMETDTQDTSGKVLRECPVKVTEEQARAAVASFLGDQMQVPPMYSALKQNGKKLYELAREGKVVERPARPVHFYELEILKMDLPRITIKVTCSKGTYIRTLCNDIGEKLGCCGCMEHLERTRVGVFKVEDAKTLGEIQHLVQREQFMEILVPIDHMFLELPVYEGSPEEDLIFHNGNHFRAKADSQMGTSRCRVYDSEKKFIGVYGVPDEKGFRKPEKMFYQRSDSEV